MKLQADKGSSGSTFVGWTRLAPEPGAKPTADPLGFQGWSDRIAEALVPDMTWATCRIRGLSLACLGFDLARRLSEDGEEGVDHFKRWERLCSLIQTRQGSGGPEIPDDPEEAPGRVAREGLRAVTLGGRHRAEKLIMRAQRPPRTGVSLDEALLASDRLGLSAYRGLAQKLRLIEGVELTTTGTTLIREAFGAGNRETRSMARELVEEGRAFLQQLDTLAGSGLLGSSKTGERREVRKAVEATNNQSLRELQRAGATHSGVSVNELRLRQVAVGRRPLVQVARLILQLRGPVEDYFRAWIRQKPGTKLDAARAALKSSETALGVLLDKSGGAGALAEVSSGFPALQAAIADADPGGALYAVHSVLMRQRGTPPFEVGERVNSESAVPDFRIPAVGRFWQDLEGKTP